MNGQRGMERRSIATRAVGALLSMPAPFADRIIDAPPITRDGRTLNRRIQLLLAGAERVGMGSGMEDSATVEDRRAELRRSAMLAMPQRLGIHVTERQIAGPAGQIRLRMYRRLGLADESPAILFFHGGGWAVGDLDTHDGSCRLLADESDCLVISVDYRLAPEHPFPAATDDAIAAYRWVHNNASELSIEPGRVGVMGDSAGGNLAAVVAQVTRDTDVPPPVAQCLVYPATDALFREPSHELFADGFFLTRESMEWYRAAYLPDSADWKSPLASPIETEDLSGVAPALVITAGFDPLRDEGRKYADRLSEAGVSTHYRCYDDMVHGFFGMGIVPGCLEMAAEICSSMGLMMIDVP